MTLPTGAEPQKIYDNKKNIFYTAETALTESFPQFCAIQNNRNRKKKIFF